MTIQTVKKWGDSPAIQIPADILQSAHLALEQAVDVRAEAGRIIIEAIAPGYTLDKLLDGIADDNLHTEVDFGAAQGREQL